MDFIISLISLALTKKYLHFQAKFQAKGTELASEQLNQFSQELAIFQTKLEEFAHKHRDEIRRNSQFRRHFQDMCASVGVDPLACKLIVAIQNKLKK